MLDNKRATTFKRLTVQNAYTVAVVIFKTEISGVKMRYQPEMATRNKL